AGDDELICNDNGAASSVRLRIKEKGWRCKTARRANARLHPDARPTAARTCESCGPEETVCRDVTNFRRDLRQRLGKGLKVGINARLQRRHRAGECCQSRDWIINPRFDGLDLNGYCLGLGDNNRDLLGEVSSKISCRCRDL